MRRSRKSDRYTEYQTQLRAAMQRLLPARGLALINSDRRVRWSDRLLVTAAVLLGWLPGNKLQEVFAATRETLVAMYPTRRRPGCGFLTLRQRSAALLALITRTLREHRGAGRSALALEALSVDGSRINCPRTVANERAFAVPARSTAPQQLHDDLPCDHRTGAWRRGGTNERDLLRDVVGELQTRCFWPMRASRAPASPVGSARLHRPRRCERHAAAPVGV